MTKNMGTIDRIVRFIFAAAVAVLYFAGTISGTLAVILGVLAVILLATSVLGFCPLYFPFKLSTIRK
jgi:hypothetical protein